MIGIFGSYSVGGPDENSDVDIITEFEQLFDKKLIFYTSSN